MKEYLRKKENSIKSFVLIRRSVFDSVDAFDTVSVRSSELLFFMAKKSQLARYAKKQKLVKKYAIKRAALKLAGDSEGLQKLPRNSSPVRLKNRCAITGRSRGYMRAFGLSRIEFRELALEGKIPGVKKSSW